MPTSSTNTDGRQPTIVFFAGKGGVGKSTCAAARAFVDARRGRRVLLLSTDPAHSLGDVLGVRLSDHPKTIVRRSGRSRGELAAVELNGPRAFERWLREHREALGDVLEHGSWLDRDDIDSLLELSLPGVDELMALVAIESLVTQFSAGAADGRPNTSDEAARVRRRSARTSRAAALRRAAIPAYDTVIVDTAPTGHTLRLLAAPDTVAAVATALDGLQEEHRHIRARFGRAGRPEAADRLIDGLARLAYDGGALLRDARRSSFHLVLLPEDLAIAETIDAMAALNRARIPVTELIVNRVTPPGPPCPNCDPRRRAERTAIRAIRELAGTRPLRIVMARAEEPRSLAALKAIGRELARPTGRSAFSVRRSTFGTRSAFETRAAKTNDERRTPNPERRTQNQEGSAAAAPERLGVFQGARLLFFGGKGGVGKTTCAAAAAIRIASANPGRRVLLLSTDPAHSLGDVLKTQIADAPRQVRGAPPNLWARELDATRALAAERQQLDEAIGEIATATGLGETSHVERIVELAPPGIDELFGIISVAPLRLSSDEPGRRVSTPTDFDLVVCDTAPTGHALRLLEMPDVARDWLQALLRVLLKYRRVVRPGRLAQTLVELSQAVRRLTALLTDPHEARFVVVTRAAELPRAETVRLLDRLASLSIAVPAIIVNAVTVPSGRCSWCRRIGSAERRTIDNLRRRRGSRAIIVTPLDAPPPSGVTALRDWAATWRVDEASSAVNR